MFFRRKSESKKKKQKKKRMIGLVVLLSVAALSMARVNVKSVVMTRVDEFVAAAETKIVAAESKVKKVGSGEECSICVQFMDQALSALIQIIANTGIAGSCGELCGQLTNQFEEEVCGVICELVGIEAFITALNDVDPDPITVCQVISICPTAPNAAGNITQLAISPLKAPVGSTFTINVNFKVTNALGTGELVIEFTPPHGGTPFGSGELLVGTQPGTYRVSATLDTNPSQSMSYPTGKYLVQAALCEGTCGGIHNDERLLSLRTSSFQLTDDK
jgi:hypothetical protein